MRRYSRLPRVGETMIGEQIKEDCDRMSEREILSRIRELCRENGIPVYGWRMYFYHSPGPKCFKRVIRRHVTHIAYIQPRGIRILEPGAIRPIAEGGLK